MIPYIIRFMYHSKKWIELYTLSLKSCLFHCNPVKVIVYYEHEGTGPAWEEARTLENVEFKQVEVKDVGDPETSNDLFKLKTLYDEGGFFLSLNFIFIKSFEFLKNFKSCIAIQCKSKKKVSYLCIGSEPQSAFIKDILKSYDDWTPLEKHNYVKYANFQPWEIAVKHCVYMIPRPIMFPWCASNKIFFLGLNIGLKQSLAIYIWPHLEDGFTMENMFKLNISNLINRILTRTKDSRIKCTLENKIISFN